MPEPSYLTPQEIYNIVKSNNKDATPDQFKEAISTPDGAKAIYSKLAAVPKYANRIPKTYNESVGVYNWGGPHVNTERKTDVTKTIPTIQKGVEQPQPQNKSLDPSTTTNLNPHSSATKPVSIGEQPTAYSQAEEDAALLIKKDNLANDFYNNNLGSPDKAQNPDYMLSKEEKQKIDSKNVLDQTRNAFTSNPTYLNENERNKYYDNIEKTVPLVDINAVKKAGDEAYQKQNTYMAHRKIAEANPTSANIAAYGMDQANAGDINTATKTFTDAISKDKNSPSGYQGLAYVSYLKKDIPTALKYIDEAIISSPNKGSLYVDKANYQWLIGSHDEAITNVNTAIDRSEFGTKDNFQAYYLRANMRQQLKNTTGATDDYDKAQQSYKQYTGEFNWAYRNKELGVGATDEKAEKETYINPYTGESITTTKEEKDGLTNDFNNFLKRHGEAPLDPSQYNFPSVRNLIDTFVREDNTKLHPPTGIFNKLNDPNIISGEEIGGSIDKGIENVITGVGGMISNFDLSKAGEKTTTEDIVKSGLKNEIKATLGIAQTTGGVFSLTPEGAAFNVGTKLLPENISNFINKPYEEVFGEQKEGSVGSDIAGLVDNATMILGITALHKGLGSISSLGSVGEPYNYKGTDFDKYGNKIQNTEPLVTPAEVPQVIPEVKTEPLASTDAAKGMASQAAAMQDQKVQEAFKSLGTNANQMAVSSFINDKIINKQNLSTEDQVKLSSMLRDNVNTGQAMETAYKLKATNNPYAQYISDKLTEFAEQNKKFYSEPSQENEPIVIKSSPEDLTPKQRTDTESLMNKVKAYNDMSPGSRGKGSVGAQKIASDIESRAKEMGYTVTRSGRGIEIRNESGNEVSVKGEGNKVTDTEFKPLEARGARVMEVYKRLKEADDIKNLRIEDDNGRALDAKQMQGAMDDVDKGVASKRATFLLDGLENQVKGETLSYRAKDISTGMQAPLEDVLKSHQGENYTEVPAEEEQKYVSKKYIVQGNKQVFELADDGTKTKVTDEAKKKQVLKSVPEKKATVVTHWIKDTKNGKEIGNIPFGDLKMARDNGNKIVDGKQYTRQTKLRGDDIIKGKATDIWFDNTEPKKGHYALVDLNKLQSAFDKEGMPNANSFIPEARPRNRDIEAISPTPADFENFNPEMVGVDPTAYRGAPVINERGEVVQGHHRNNELKQYLSGLGDPNGYYDHLKEISKETGISEKDIENNPDKALVRVISEGNDNNHIELGQNTSRDMNNVTPLHIAWDHFADLTTDQAKSFSRLWGNERSLGDLLSHKGDKVAKWLANEGFLKPTDANIMLTPDQMDLNHYGLNRHEALIRGMLFRGAYEGVEQSFKSLPKEVQVGLENAIPVILKMGDDAPLNQITNAIMAYGQFLDEVKTSDPHQLRIQADQFLDKHKDLFDERDHAMIKAMTGMTSPFDMGEMLDMMHDGIKGNELQGLKPLSANEAYDNIFGSTGKTDGTQELLNQQNSLYGKERGKETDAGTNTGAENTAKQPELPGETQGQGSGQTTGDARGTESGEQIAKKHFIATFDEVQQMGIMPALDSTSLANKAGIFSYIYKNILNRPLKHALDEIDSQRDKNKGLMNTQWARVREGYDDLVKQYPDLASKESHEAVWDAFDKKRTDPDFNVDKAELTHAQRQLHDFTIELKKYAADIIQKARVYGLVTDNYVNMVNQTLEGYLPRIAKDYADNINSKIKEMEAKSTNRALFEAKERSAVGYLGETYKKIKEDRQNKKGMTKENLSDFSHSQKYWHAVKVADKNGTRLVDRGKATIVYFNDKTGSIARFEDAGTKEPKYFGRFGGTADEVKSEKDIVNPTIDKVIRDGQLRDALGNYYELKQAPTSEITKFTGQEYIKNPVYAAAKLLEGATNTYTANLLYKTIKNDTKFAPYRRIFNPAEQQLADQLSNIQEANVDLRKEKINEFNKNLPDANKIPLDFFEKFQLPEEGVLPKSFDNVYIRKDAYNAIKNAMTIDPTNAEAATRQWLSLVLYPKLIGLRHFYNVSSDYTRNSVNVENLGLAIKDAKEKKAFTDIRLAHDQVINGGEFAKMMSNEGFNTMFRAKDDKMTFINGVIEQEMAQDTKFHDAIELLSGKKDFSRALITSSGDKAKAVGMAAGNMLKKVSKATTWYGTDLFNYAQVIKEMRLGGLKVPKEGLDGINWNDASNRQMMRDAVKRVESRLVTYKVKTFVGTPNNAGRWLSKGLRNKAITVFGGYDLGIMKVLLNDVKKLSSAGINQGGFTEVGSGNREAINAAQRLAMTGLMVYGFHKLYQVVNQDSEDKVTKFSVPGTAGLANRTINWLKGDMDKGDYARSLFHLSPVITDLFDVVQNTDYNNRPIYSRTWAGNNWSNVKDIVSYLMLSGTNVAQLRSHLTDGEWKQAGDDAEKMLLPISKSKYTPAETEVIKNLFNYKDFFEQKVKSFQNDIDNATSDKAKAKAQSALIDQVYRSESSLLDQTIHFTRLKIEDFESGVRSPLDHTQDDALQFYKDFYQEMLDRKLEVETQFQNSKMTTNDEYQATVNLLTDKIKNSEDPASKKQAENELNQYQDKFLDSKNMSGLFDEVAAKYIIHKE